MHAIPRRAITLAGGGPEAALHIGALAFFEQEAKISFDIWALSCIGAWVGIYYQRCEEGKQAEQTRSFFREQVFRDDISYERFPINAVFGPDIVALSRATMEFLSNPESYRDIVLPDRIMAVAKDSFAFLGDTKRWNEGDFSKFLLEFLAAHPYSRFLTSLMYLSNLSGLTKTYYKGSSLLNSMQIEELKNRKPFIFHNAFNLNSKQLQLFANRVISDSYKPISPESLCACSALPYIEETVTFDGSEYCEGALVDTVNFENLLDDTPLMLGDNGAELDEILGQQDCQPKTDQTATQSLRCDGKSLHAVLRDSRRRRCQAVQIPCEARQEATLDRPDRGDGFRRSHELRLEPGELR